jgi:hypothetical protein
LKYWRRLWADANNDWGLNNNAGSSVISVSGMGTPSTSTTTFAGDVTLNKLTTSTGLEYQVRNTNGASGNHVFKSYNTSILTLDGGTNNSTFAGSVIANTGSKITSSSTDTTFSIETTSGSTIFPILDFVSSHSSAGARIRVSGTDVISIDKSQNATFAGNVGIGTDSLSTKLSIQRASNAINTEISFKDGGGTRAGVIGMEGATTNDMLLSTLGGIRFYTASNVAVGSVPTNERMRIDSDGNVGIGGSPNNFTNQKSLTINGIAGGNSRLDFQINGTNEAEIVANDASLIISHNDILQFYTGASQRMHIDSIGRMGFNSGIETDTRHYFYSNNNTGAAN